MKLEQGDYILSIWASVGTQVSTVTTIIRRRGEVVGEFAAYNPGLFAGKLERHGFRPAGSQGSSFDEIVARNFQQRTYEDIAERDEILRWIELDIFSSDRARYEDAKKFLTSTGFEWQWELCEKDHVD